ncbi:MAG: PspC domain-containing protein [Candidatus Zixiibacteriota bacterium]|nr:MAG: PspC domain-containing protein [candidate division Zixibacteria bacterium]
MEKRLYLSDSNKVIAGVCGGLGEYFEIDPVLVRIILVILCFAWLGGLLAYIVAWIAMPRRPEGQVAEVQYHYSSWHKYIPGVILILIGVVLMAREFWFWFDFEELWPGFLILAGLALLFFGRGKSKAGESPGSVNGAINENQPNGKNDGGNV